MNEITMKIWDRGLTIKKWAAINGFNAEYARHIIAGRRGKWEAGTAKKIINALKNQGFWVEPEE